MDLSPQQETGFSILLEDARETIRSTGIDPLEDQLQARQIIDETVSSYEARMFCGSLPTIDNLASARGRLFNTLCGFGELQPLLDDPHIEEIWINSPSEIFIARSGESELTGISLTQDQIELLVERMLKISGRRIDRTTPFVDASMPDGSRLHVAIPDITRKHWAINIRKFVTSARTLEDLVALGSISRRAAVFLDAAVKSGLNILVSGATQSGKTTLLNCLAASIGQRERVITCEEIFELKVPLRDVVNMQCRQENLEGKGEIPLRKLVKEALRMRPDRLLIGEVREAEALDMLIALNAGLPGMCTLHANSADDAITKICTLPLLAGENISSRFVLSTVAACFDLVVHCARDLQGKRYVREIAAVGSRTKNEIIETWPVFVHNKTELICLAGELPAAEKFLQQGYLAEQVLPQDSGRRAA